MLLLSPGLAVFIYGLAEMIELRLRFGAFVGADRGRGAADRRLVRSQLAHAGSRYSIVRTFVHTRAGYAGTSFFLFLAIPGSENDALHPLTTRRCAAPPRSRPGCCSLPAASAHSPADVSLRTAHRPLRPTWRLGQRTATGRDQLIPFAFVGATTSYVLLCAGSFVQGLGMGLAMTKSNMTAAMQAVPPSAIARTSTAMNIIRQAGASVRYSDPGRLLFLASAITSNLALTFGAHAPGSGLAGSRRSSTWPWSTLPNRHAACDAFASTFVWALATILIALIPVSGWRSAAGVPARSDRSPATELVAG